MLAPSGSSTLEDIVGRSWGGRSHRFPQAGRCAPVGSLRMKAHRGLVKDVRWVGDLMNAPRRLFDGGRRR
jgi:hypothetical protein